VARGTRLEVDRRLGDVPRKNIQRDGNSPRRNFGELICLLVVLSGHVVKLYAVELVLEGPHGFAVRLHLIVVTARVLHDLVDHDL
jgi:hypothetical protein